MDKEKQIEEMAQCIDCTPFLFEKDIKNCVYLKQGIGCDRYKFAKENYDKGYRKINEDEIVLSKKDTQKYFAYKIIEPQIKGCLDRERELERQLETIRKETAEKIYRELQGHGTTYVKKWIRENYDIEIEG